MIVHRSKAQTFHNAYPLPPSRSRLSPGSARVRPERLRFNDGVAAEIRKHGLPWNVQLLGCRAEYTFCQRAPRTGGESAAAADFEMERFLHLYALNRGVLLTPFHNMALMCPETTAADIDRHTRIFAEAAEELV